MPFLFRNNFNKTFKISSILLLLVLNSKILLAQNTAQENPNERWINLAVKDPFLKIILTFDVAFFVALAALCTLIYLFFRHNRIVLWYIGLMSRLSFAYIAALIPFYFNNSTSAFLFYFFIKLAQSGGLICGLKIIQDLSEIENAVKFRRLFLLGLFGFLGCIIAYFNEILYVPLSFFYYLSCLIILYQTFAFVREGVKNHHLESNFVILFIIINVLFIVQAFPITSDNDNSVSTVRMIINVLLPFSITGFLAMVFAKYSKSFFQKQAEVKALNLEKQAILEAQNETLEKQVTEQTAELQSLNATKDRLFLIIGHDLRSPIASLKSVLQMLNDKHISKKDFEDLLQHLQHDVDNVFEMLENLLYWSMSQMEGFKPNFQKNQVKEIVEINFGLFSKIANQKQIELKHDINEKLSVFVDENHFHTILRNLLNNAIKFTPQNGQITVEAKAKREMVSIKIIDSGIGIKPEDLSMLFSKPKLKSGTLGEKSTGLGLILCRDLIEHNNGKIVVKSIIDKGTTFEILLKSAN